MALTTRGVGKRSASMPSPWEASLGQLRHTESIGGWGTGRFRIGGARVSPLRGQRSPPPLYRADVWGFAVQLGPSLTEIAQLRSRIRAEYLAPASDTEMTQKLVHPGRFERNLAEVAKAYSSPNRPKSDPTVELAKHWPQSYLMWSELGRHTSPNIGRARPNTGRNRTKFGRFRPKPRKPGRTCRKSSKFRPESRNCRRMPAKIGPMGPNWSESAKFTTTSPRTSPQNASAM